MFAVDNGLSYSRSDAILSLFGIKLTDFKKFKNKIATLEDNKCILLEIEKSTGATGSRGKRSYLPRQLNRLHNVVLISGFFSKPAIVKDVVEKLSRRKEHVEALRNLLAGRDRVGNIQFDVGALSKFFDCLESCQSLDDQRFPNPFIQLPQVIDNGSGQFSCVLDAYNSADMEITQLEKMLAAYLGYEIELAYQLSTSLDVESDSVFKMKQWVEREYQEAQCFDDLLESFLN
mgnify:CR=1 FL=1